MRQFTLLFTLLFSALCLSAQDARVQIIHNSPSPTVDIWVNNVPFQTNFAFRTATPFVDVPAGVPLSIGIAPSPSSSPDDIIATFDVTLEEDESYVIFAQGIVGNMDTPFDLNVYTGASEVAQSSNEVTFIVAHGSPDAPAVDVDARDVAQLVNGAAYTNVTDYITVPAGSYLLDVRADDTEPIVATFRADLSGLGGMSATVFASGFLAPGANEPEFGLFAALADGTVVELPRTSVAQAQIIHNSPSPTVDIWVNNEPFVTDFDFRTATPFVEVPADVNLSIGIAPSPSSSPDDIIATFDVTLENGENYMIMANGVVGSSTAPFDLDIASGVRKTAMDDMNFEFLAVHGSPDAPAVDIFAREVAQLVDGAPFGAITDYISVPADNYLIDIKANDTEPIVATFRTDVSGLAGATGVVFASGFLAPGADDPEFGLFAALTDGTIVELPRTSIASAQIIHNSPSPTVDIWVNNEPFVTDFDFRTATPFVEVPADVNLSIGVAPSPSSSPDDIIATFDVTLENGENYVIMANGVVGSSTAPFDLDIASGVRKAADDGANFDFLAVHGSPDAPAVDIFARDVAQLVDGAAFGDITDYISVPADSYLIDVKANDTDPIVATFLTDVSGLAGEAGVVFASGFLAPGMDEPEFGLYATLTDGTVVELPRTAIAQVQLIHNSPSPTVDIWVNNEPFLTDFDFRTATPFVNVPADEELNIGVAPSPSSSPDDIIATFNATFENGENYVVVANGVVGSSTAPFDLDIASDVRRSAEDAANVDFIVVHGSPDAPAVDVDARGVAQLVNGAAFGDITDYISVPEGQYLLDVKPAGADDIVASFDGDLNGLAGGSAVVFASGFLTPGTDDPAFGLFVALTDGTVIQLSQTAAARLQIIHNSPEPTVDIWVNNEPFQTNFAFRDATPFVDIPADEELVVGVAVSPSTSPDDIIATFPVTPANGGTYIAIAQGIVGNTDTPFTIDYIAGIREASLSADVDLLVIHGSPDAPEVDVLANGGTPPLVDDLEYREATDYISVPADAYELGITPSDDNGTVLFNYDADLSGLGGGSAVVFASGLLGDAPAFGLWVALADGTTFALPLIVDVNELEALEALTMSPNPAKNYTIINYNLSSTTDMTIRVMDQMGREVVNNRLGNMPAGEHIYELSTAGWSAGMYFVSIQSPDGMFSTKLMVK